MKRIFNMIFLLAGAMGGICEDAPAPSIRVEPVSLEVRTRGINQYSKKGTIVQIKIINEDDSAKSRYGLCHFAYWVDNPSAATISLVDSEGKDLGELVVFVPGSMDRYYFTFKRFPSPGAKWVCLKGHLPIELLVGDQQTTESIPFNIKEGNRVKVGEFDVEVIDIKQEGKIKSVEFLIKNDSKQYQILDFPITDAKGKKVADIMGSGGNMADEAITRQKILYGMYTDVEDVHLSITYQNVKSVMVPLNMKINLYHWND